MADFEFPEEEEDKKPVKKYRQGESTYAPWWHTASAVLVGALLAGIILLLGVRLYIKWSIEDAIKKPENPIDRKK